MNPERLKELLGDLFEEDQWNGSKQELGWCVEQGYVEWDKEVKGYYLSNKGYNYIYGFEDGKEDY